MKEIILTNASIIIGGLIGFSSSLTILVVTLWAERKKFQRERSFNLKKEEYFNLQNKAQEVVRGLTLLERRVDGLMVSLKKKIKVDFEDDGLECRLNMVSCFEIFFPEIDTSGYNKAVDSMHRLAEIYLFFYQDKTISPEQQEKAESHYNFFHNSINSLVDRIKEVLADKRAQIKL